MAPSIRPFAFIILLSIAVTVSTEPQAYSDTLKLDAERDKLVMNTGLAAVDLETRLRPPAADTASIRQKSEIVAANINLIEANQIYVDPKILQNWRALLSQAKVTLRQAENNGPPEPKCLTTPMDEHLINPLGIQSYLERNANTLKSIDDAICCLPKSCRTDLAIAFESIAGQNSDFKNPRVIMFCKRPGTNELELALSINGGDPSLRQTSSIELLYNDKYHDTVAMYDLELKKDKFHLGDQNPELCVTCHGKEGAFSDEGLKTIFDPVGLWPRLVGGLGSGDNFCGKYEGAYMKAMYEQSAQAFKNQRYKCLAAGIEIAANAFTGGAEGLFDIDRMLANVNDRRTVKAILVSKDYEKYKFVILGSFFCNGSTELVGNELKSHPFDLKQWIPASALSEMSQKESLLPEIQTASDLPKLCEDLIRKRNDKDKEIDKKQGLAILQIANGQTQDRLLVQQSPQCNVHPLGVPHGTSCEDPAIKSWTGENKALAQYKVDSIEKGFRTAGTMVNPVLRFLFESRGIDTSDWQMQVDKNTYQRDLSGVGPLLLQYQAILDKDLGITTALNRSYNLLSGQRPMPGDPTEPLQRAKLALRVNAELCKKLQEKSLQALSSIAVPENSTTEKIRHRAQ